MVLKPHSQLNSETIELLYASASLESKLYFIFSLKVYCLVIFLNMNSMYKAYLDNLNDTLTICYFKPPPHSIQ